MSVNLSTTYLGLKLPNPLVISACPLTHRVDWLRQLEANGAAAAVLPSLFEEQIEHDDEEINKATEFHTDSFAESLTYFPEQEEYRTGPEEYLKFIAEAKQRKKKANKPNKQASVIRTAGIIISIIILRKLKAEINAEAWATLNSDTSRPFDKPKNGRIAVKVINHLGDEVMKVFKV